MSDINVQIDGKEIVAKEGMTILEAAKSAGIPIPTLCHHEKLEPYGACRICTVEVEIQGRKLLVASCVYPVEPNAVITTRSEAIDEIRKMILELLLAHAPDAPALQDLAKEYGANEGRFEKEPSFCILCGLCVRYCAEVKGKNALAFVDQGPKREICFVPEVASKECWNCKECFPLCPTSYLQAAYVLTEGLVGFKNS
jgi:bidirectional [NiFe] hydrogenase diaphorase subunit